MDAATPAKEYDVCIVGSGAGSASSRRAPWDARKDGAMFVWSYDSPRRGIEEA